MSLLGLCLEAELDRPLPPPLTVTMPTRPRPVFEVRPGVTGGTWGGLHDLINEGLFEVRHADPLQVLGPFPPSIVAW